MWVFHSLKSTHKDTFAGSYFKCICFWIWQDDKSRVTHSFDCNNVRGEVDVSVWVCACVRVWVCECVRVCVCECLSVCVCVLSRELSCCCWNGGTIWCKFWLVLPKQCVSYMRNNFRLMFKFQQWSKFTHLMLLDSNKRVIVVEMKITLVFTKAKATNFW